MTTNTKASSGPLAGRREAALLTTAREAFTAGLHEVAGISAALLAGVAILAMTLLRHVRPIGESEPEGAPEAVSAPDHAPERTPVAASA
jgi:MFS transporter, DHA2 family, multidrug resistance protein